MVRKLARKVAKKKKINLFEEGVDWKVLYKDFKKKTIF